MEIEKLRQGDRAVGTMLRMVNDPGVAWMAHHAGLDFIMLDMEHGLFSMETAADVFKVGRALGLGCFVRVPELTKGYVSRIMDAGATGVMVPMLETVEQAEQFVTWAKYGPLGNRGFGGVGVHTDYDLIASTAMPAFMERTNQETLTIAQIETRTAVDNVDAIAKVPGIDALLIGPNDLGISLGCAGEFMGDVLDRAIGKVAETAQRHGKIFGLHGSEALLDRWIPRGCTLIMSNIDATILSAGMKAISSRFRP